MPGIGSFVRLEELTALRQMGLSFPDCECVRISSKYSQCCEKMYLQGQDVVRLVAVAFQQLKWCPARSMWGGVGGEAREPQVQRHAPADACLHNTLWKTRCRFRRSDIQLQVIKLQRLLTIRILVQRSPSPPK